MANDDRLHIAPRAKEEDTASMGSFLDGFQRKEMPKENPTRQERLRISAEVKNLTMDEAEEGIVNNMAVVLDVRKQEDYFNGHIPGAINLQEDDIILYASSNIRNLRQIIFVYSTNGRRSARACRLLMNIGYENVYNLGGIINWTGELES
ncbi:MAG: rhodanese-like domain-containing protein [Solobacterium sp.]|nr:rhodanese-like domain-containing protein [Solobacterium sp.]